MDEKYRDDLISLFDLDPSKKVPGLFEWEPSEGLIDRGGYVPPFSVCPRRAPTSGLDPLMEQAFRQCIQEAKRHGQTVFLSSHILSEVGSTLRPGRHLRQGGWWSPGP